ncbi:methyltransferase [Shewanella algae]|uniref:tRNA1(Val) (adenine(37)-N6)-methyltransferase n=1 Tax=Shewanella algae TaxID=38313 RepID=UPI0011825F44|nr:methyltransferase [Shewanella algae]TVL60404.1 tRNA(1)(Val) (adenine(37)-N(6))-methyltransferase [Shewanella algae]
MAFSFKAFHIEDYGCGMPVSTDGVLLGAWAPLTGAKRVLDIGAGSGLLSLMAAQRSEAEILAVELDSSAAHASSANFKASPWASRLALYQGSIQAYCDEHALIDSVLFDHILCNPPYFETGPRSDDPKRAIARHTEHLSFDELCVAIKQLLKPQGQASLILPVQSLDRFVCAAIKAGLRLAARVSVSSTPQKPSSRELLLLEHAKEGEAVAAPKAHPFLYIREADGRYSEAMAQLTRDFYLKL